MIRLKKEIKEFKYLGTGHLENEIITPILISDVNFANQENPLRQLIVFGNEKGKVIKMDLTGNSESTKTKELYWDNFSDKILTEIATIFNLKLKKATHKTEGDCLIAYFDKIQLDASLALKEFEDNLYVCLFHLDLPDFYRGAGSPTGKIYFERIVQVEFSDDIKNKILF